MASNVSRLDTVYRSLLISRFFTKGWGKPEHLKRLFELRRQMAKRSTAYSFVDKDHPITITKQELKSDHRVLEGYFITPFANIFPEIVPEESVKAHFQVLLPLKWPNPYRPMCVQYAGTGDHFFWRRRRMMGLPMLRERGIGSIILENPFYGLRKPKEQYRSSLQQVTDLFVMGACLILESVVLFNWCEKNGFWPLAAHGISMGGHMASLGATVWPKPLALIPCLSWSTASSTFTKGVMSNAIPWEELEHQYSNMTKYRDELAQMIQCEANAFRAGVEFAQNYNATLKHREEIFEDTKLENFLSSSQDQVASKIIVGPDDNEKMNENAVEKTARSKSFLNSLQLPSFLEYLPSAIKFSSSSSSKPQLDESVLQPFRLKSGHKPSQSELLRREAVQFFSGVMDECTHLKNFDVPFDPSLIIIVVAENDAYQPREGVAALPDIWPGAKLRFIHDNGHVASYLFKQDVFRSAIYEAFDSLIQKYGKSSYALCLSRTPTI